jgi:hypothetical protein
MDLIPCRFPFCIDRETGCFAECTAHLAATARDVIPQIPSDAKRRRDAKKRAADHASNQPDVTP